MQGYNCIMIFEKDMKRMLMCERMKDPYKGLYNLVGGKIEPGEDGEAAAYRELFEETGISQKDVKLLHLMDFTYYCSDCYVECYAGRLSGDVKLVEEKNPLLWMEVEQDFFTMERFAGEGNIGHMLEQVKLLPPSALDGLPTV